MSSNSIIGSRGAITLNLSLLEKQNISEENKKAILSLHVEKPTLYDSIERETNVEALKILTSKLRALEFKLQALCGFKMNSNYPKFWEITKCSCPKMDNEERYPTGYYVFNSSYPLHGE